ncbi:MAG: histidine kinase [Methylococcaceae bacterium]
MRKILSNPVLIFSVIAPLVLGYFYLAHEVDPKFERLGRALAVAMINSLTLFVVAWFFSGTELLKILFISNKDRPSDQSISTPLIIVIFSLLYLLNLQLLQLIVAHSEQTVLDRGFIVILLAALFLKAHQSIIICCFAFFIRLGFYFYHDPQQLPLLSNPRVLLEYDWLIIYPGIVAILAAFLTGLLCRYYFINQKAVTISPWIGFTLAMIIEPIYLGALLKQTDIEFVTLVLTTETVPNIVALGGTMTVLLYMLHGLHADLERSQNKKAELAVLQENLRYLRVQMNPHFLFNTLNTISHFISEKPAYAKELLLDFSDMFRHVVHDETLLVSFEKELEFVKMYVGLEMARLGGRLSIKYDVDESALPIQIPTLTLQPLVENAIKHGFSETHQKIELKFACLVQEDKLVIKILDNGKGMSDPIQINKGEGIGLKNIRKRLHLLYDDEAKIHIQSVLGEGSRVTVVIPRKISMRHMVEAKITDAPE